MFYSIFFLYPYIFSLEIYYLYFFLPKKSLPKNSFYKYNNFFPIKFGILFFPITGSSEKCSVRSTVKNEWSLRSTKAFFWKNNLLAVCDIISKKKKPE